MGYFFDLVLVGGVATSLSLFLYGTSLYSSIKRRLISFSPKVHEDFFGGGAFGSSVERQKRFNKFVFSGEYSGVSDSETKELLSKYAFVGRLYKVIFAVTVLVFFAMASGIFD